MEAYLRSNGAYGKFTVGQEFFCLIDTELINILMDSHTHLSFENFAEIVFGKAYLITECINAQFIFIVRGYVFQRNIYNRFLGRSQFFDRSDIEPQFIEGIEDIVNRQGCAHKKPGIIFGSVGVYKRIVHFDIVIKYIDKRIAQNDVILGSDHIVEKFCMASAQDKIKITPVQRNPCEYNFCIAGGSDDRMRLHINGAFAFAVSGSAVYRVKQQVIIIVSSFSEDEFSVVEITAFFNIERKRFHQRCDMENP